MALAPNPSGRSLPRWWRLAAAVAAALAAVPLASCGGACPQARELRDADPAWQRGSEPASATAFIGNEVARRAADAWAEGLDEAVRSALAAIPGIGGALAGGTRFDVSVDEARFERAASGSGVALVFAMSARAGLDPEGSRLGRAGRVVASSGLANVRVELELRAPVALRPTADHTELAVRLSAVEVRVVGGSLGPLGAAIDDRGLVDRLRERLISAPDLVVARIAPVELESFATHVRAVGLRFETEHHLAVDLELVEVPAPAGAPTPTLPSDAPADAIVLALAPASALALGDFGLRVAGADGFTKRGRPGGPYAARLRSFRVEDERVVLEITALRCRGLCGAAELSSVVRISGSGGGIEVHVEDARVEDASRARRLASAALPSPEVLSRRATEATRALLTGSAIEIPRLPRAALRLDTIRVVDGAVLGYARLYDVDSGSDAAHE